jgi:hypothetical protein
MNGFCELFLTDEQKIGVCVKRGDVFNYYYLNGKLHREDGPAIESSGKFGVANYYYLGGTAYYKPSSDLEWSLKVKKWKEKNGN